MEKITATCPKCDTQYQLTKEQLSIADGKVRCSACMNVFHAIPMAVSTSSPTPSNFVIDDEERIQDGIDDDIPPANDAFVTDFDQIQANTDAYGTVDDDDDLSRHDEEWAEQLLRELEEESDEVNEVKAENTNADFSTTDKDVTKLLDEELEDLDELEDLLTLKESEPEPKARNNDTLSAHKEDLLDRIEAEPIEFQYSGKKHLGKKILSVLVCTLLIATAISQLFIFQFNDLSRKEKWRPLYTKVCSVVGCTLPDQQDLQQISTSHLSVKSHPYLSSILIVDTVLTNHAPFDQPFPNLELFFTGDNQRIIAARALSPADYLRGELANRANMPQRQPIHIAIELVDPGAKANGYFIQIKPASK